MNSRLEPLPENNDKEFWEDSELHGGLVPQEIVYKTHYFVRKSGREAQCMHCDWGFALDPGDYIKDGHLYDKTGKLVI